jgi:hypothetical protein
MNSVSRAEVTGTSCVLFCSLKYCEHAAMWIAALFRSLQSSFGKRFNVFVGSLLLCFVKFRASYFIGFMVCSMTKIGYTFTIVVLMSS